MASKPDREFHLQLLAQLLLAFEAPEIVQAIDYEVDGHTGTMKVGGLVRLTSTERAYLVDVCRRALAGHHDPLKIDMQAGGQTARSRLLAEAQQVHELVNRGDTLTEACRQVADILRRKDHTGLAKNYREHRHMLEAADRFYGARAAGKPFDDADLTAMLSGRTKGN